MKGLEIAHHRLASQGLSGRSSFAPVAVVRHFGAMQAQEFAVAKWSIGQRSPGTDDTTIQKLIDNGAILRTHALRPTWHFVAAEDIGWIQALTGPRVRATIAYYYRQHGIDDDLAHRSNRIIAAALKGGNTMTRAEIGQALAASKIEATGVRLAHLLMNAEIDGLIASGPMRGKQHTYALIDERSPNLIEMSHDQALAELTVRYFTSHGPATVKDFAWWASLTATEIKRGLAIAGDALVPEEVNGTTYWFAPPASPQRDRSPAVHVLQSYDEYVVAYAQSRPVINVAELTINTPNRNALAHSIILDSQMIGYWRRNVERGGHRVQPVLACEVTTAERRAVDEAFNRYAVFAGVPVTVEWPTQPDATVASGRLSA